MNNKQVVRISISVAILASFASFAWCCSIPVFRYALEHWSPETYVVRVSSDSKWSESQLALVRELSELEKTANIRLIVSEGQKSTGEIHDSARLEVHMPRALDGASPIVWDGPFTKESIQRLLSSPVRQRICQGLANQDSVAWVFLESGDSAVDDTKFFKLESELRRLESVIKLPPIDAADLKDLSKSPEELKIQFSAHRVSRSDPSESAFIAMLLATESDLREEFEQGSPMAFPVFGRGRVLYALLGDGIATSTIEEACRFLAGACQCTVKADNPGIDILASFDWDEHVQITSPKKGRDMQVTGLGPVSNRRSLSSQVNAAGPLSTGNAKASKASDDESSLSTKLDEAKIQEELPRAGGLSLERSRVDQLWLTLGVLGAFVGTITIVWMFFLSPKV